MKTLRFLVNLVTIALFAATFCSCFAADRTKTQVQASTIMSNVKKGKPVHLVNKIIMGDLDFTDVAKHHILNANMLQCDVQSNILFENCIFMGKVTANGKRGNTAIQTRFMSNLIFTGCDFRGVVDFDNATVFGMVNFSRTTFREDASFNNLAAWAKDSYFSEMKAEKRFTMIYASFAGNLTFLNAAFAGVASFQETSTNGKLVFNNSVFNERAGFDMMQTLGNAFFNYTRFEKFTDFSQSRFFGVVEFLNANFEQNANFVKTKFAISVNFDGVDRYMLIIDN